MNSLCFLFVIDKCRKGAECRDRHPDKLEVKAIRDRMKETTCRFGARCSRPDCVFSHPEGRVLPPDEPRNGGGGEHDRRGGGRSPIRRAGGERKEGDARSPIKRGGAGRGDGADRSPIRRSGGAVAGARKDSAKGTS